MKDQLLWLMLLAPLPANSIHLSPDQICKNLIMDDEVECLMEYHQASGTCIPEFKKCFYRNSKDGK